MLLNFAGSMFRASTPILYTALGVLLMQSAGVLNMGAEGMMLIGAFGGVIATFYTGNVYLGFLIAGVITSVFGLLFAWVAQRYKVNQVVLGVVFNLFASGLTTTLSRGVFGLNADPPKLDSFHYVIFSVTWPMIVVFLLVPVFHFVFYKTKAGVYLRGTGHHPKAVEVAGLNVYKIRYIASLAGAFLIGLGGAFLSLGQLSFFIEDMANGRGYIALAAVTFGCYKPVPTMAAVLMFGAGEALVYLIQATGSKIPYQFALMIPYILTIAVLALFVKDFDSPKALGEQYTK